MSDTKDPWAEARPMLEKMLVDGRAQLEAIMAGAPSTTAWPDALLAALDALARSGKPGASQENLSPDVPE